MRIFPSKSVRRVGLRALLLAPVFLIGQTCTDLTEVPHDALTPNNAFHTDAEVLAGVAAVYAQLRSQEEPGYLTLEELSTDALIVPTRGNDWYDNGQWLDIHRQTWSANSSAELSMVDPAWNDLFAGVAKANLMIDVITKAGGAEAPQTLAELRSLRAWYYYMLQDLFGGVPLVTTTEVKQYPRVSRDSIFRFIESELLDSRDKLPVQWDASMYGRMTKGADNAILASLYLNAGVFDVADTKTIDANGYNSCSGVKVSGGKDACQAAIDAADAVIGSGVYTLNPNWSQNFSIDNKSSPENIFVIVHTKEQNLGGNWPMRTLHYNQLATGDGGPWNGFATLAETYNKFSATDDRRNMWLEGQAYSFETGKPVTDRQGNNLVFTIDIPDATAAGENIGVRFNKFPPLPSTPHGNSNPNDFPFFRLAEMYLIKAEALNEMGNTAGATTELARIHNMHDPSNPIASGLSKTQLRTAILNERLFELTAEGKRRTDLIRHGLFLKQWSTATKNGKTDKSAETYRILFPISALQLQSNPLLT
ncbi:MAG TPA: RagB/SusD family nutrient uptake outer membrane protein, partial [Gemmatimonadaceae bacterium]|nr:RagB/SusD family nutrient uptake outer membrane protein [Gemmatimonadaceae bacterium]